MPLLRWRKRQRVPTFDNAIELDELPFVRQQATSVQNTEFQPISIFERIKKSWKTPGTQDSPRQGQNWTSFFSKAEFGPSVSYSTIGFTDLYSYRDAQGRTYSGPREDKTLSPIDGALVPLTLQASKYVIETGGNTWKRTELSDVHEPLFVASLPYLAYRTAKKNPSTRAWLAALVFWPFCCLLILFLMLFGGSWHGKERNRGKYDPLVYKYWGYMKLARNAWEECPDSQTGTRQSDHGRPPFPRYLCHLNQPESKYMEGVKITGIQDVITNTIDPKDMAYAYIAMTGTQFSTSEDYLALHKMAERATRDAGLTAYWVAISCMPEAEFVEEDVYNIDSYCRNSKMMFVALGSKINGRDPFGKLELIRDFGNRLWCRPYLLHSPLGARIKIYFRGESAENHLSLTKRGFALLAFSGEDASMALRLLDHQEGRIRLGPVEYFVLCAKFLTRGGTTQYLPGDLYYVLMGTLPRRPTIDRTDTAWQAFCRLCLANEDHKILERIVCHLSIQNAHWATADDAWGVALWDIDPYCQVAGVANNDMIILDGAYASTIKWDAFDKVDFPREHVALKAGTGCVLRCSPLILAVGIILLSVGSTDNRIPGLVLILLGTILIACSPFWVCFLYSYNPKTHDTQPCFFGVEGHVPLDKLSRLLFGQSYDPPRLRWSPYSSMLSRHHMNTSGECEGVDPISSPEIAMLQSMSKESRLGEPKMFTLVDTGTMTVTLFMARRPPIAVLCCGQEGGMHRALMCSLDYTTSSLHRETVLRMESTVVDRMSRIGKVQLSLSSSAIVEPVHRSDFQTFEPA